MTLVALILAGGQSKRLGRPKQLLEFEGEPLLRRSVRQATETGADRVVVVVGAFADAMERSLEGSSDRLSIVRNQGWREGLGSSLACGANSVQHLETECTALLLMLCDQPLIPITHLKALVRAFELQDRNAATRYPDGSLGVPVCFASRYLPTLGQMSGGIGAKGLIASEPVIDIRCPEAALDIDVPEDVIELHRRGARSDSATPEGSDVRPTDSKTAKGAEINGGAN